MALTFHQMGKARARESTLHSSMMLYDMCARISLHYDQSRSNAFAFLALAALNNCGCLCVDLGFKQDYGRIQEIMTEVIALFQGVWTKEELIAIREFCLNNLVSETAPPAARSA